MPNYTYRARDRNGKLINGILTAESDEVLASKLGEMELMLIDFQAITARRIELISIGRVKRRDIILFTNHLAMSLEAGISLIMAITDYAEETDNPKFKRIIEDINRQVLSGSTFTDALAKYPKTFSDLYVSIIATGEATGHLPKVLSDLVSFLEWQEDLAGQVKQASIYPAFLVSMIIGVITIMMVVTIPKFLPLLKSFNVALPMPTRVLIWVSEFFQKSWYWLLSGIAAFLLSYRISNQTAGGRFFWDTIKLNLPLFGKMQLKIVLSKFAHYFSMLFGAGISLLQAFVIIQRVVQNEVIRRSLQRAHDAIEKGSSIYDALSKESRFPSLVLRMIQVGETTGSLDASLEKASKYYDREVPATIKKIFATFEPLLILVMGGVVLFIALSIFLPIYKLTSTIGMQR